MTKNLPVLIIDKKGILGSLIAQKISDKSLIVLVSKKVPQENLNILHIPFSGSVPTIPDNTYSKILIIDDKNSITKDSLDTFIKKAEEDKSDLFFATYLGLPLDTISQKLTTYEKGKIIVIGEVFDDEYIIEDNTPTRFIAQIKKEGKIEIAGDGTASSFPVALEDIVNGLSEIISREIKGSLICLFPKNPITHLSLAHLFQKQNPLIRIDFKKGSSKKNLYASPLDGFFYLGENPELSEKIKKINLGTVRTYAKAEVIKTPYFFRRGFIALTLSVLFIALLPFLTTYSFGFLGAQQLLGVKEQLVQGNFKEAREKSKTASTFLKIAKYSSDFLKIEAGFIGQSDKTAGIGNQIESLYLVSQASNYLTESAEKFSLVFKNPSYSKNDFLGGVNALKNSVTKFREIEARSELPPSVQHQFSDYSSIIDLLESSVDYLPSALGFEGEKKYLLLFQNNMELRPGGGFIGSYAISSIKEGKVTDFKIYDVYDADGQLKEHLEPPFPIRRYLPSAHFYLRDSNFYLNFSDNALAAQNFLSIEKKEKFDGVVSIDVSFTKAILEVLGGVNVPNYGEKVTSENFFELADKYSRESFFPGSTQKKDFLGAVFRSIQEELSIRKVPYLAFAQAAAKGVSEKHIQFYFNDPIIQNTALVGGMSPGVLDTRTKSEGDINDYTGVVEANLGVNKVNKDVARTISKSFEVKDDGTLISTINVAYKNNSSKDNYKNYVRFITPLGSKLENIKINGREQEIAGAVSDPGVYESKNFKPPKGLEVLSEVQSGKTIFGFLVSVSKENIKTIGLTYSFPGKINPSSSSVNYSLRFIKQPGTEDFPFSFQVLFPESLNYINSSQQFKIADGKISFETQLEKDLSLNIKLSPK